MAISEHDKCKKIVIEYFLENKIKCNDFEKEIGDKKIKRPDLVLPQLETLIEVKTLQPNEQERIEQKDLMRKLQSEGCATYWIPEFFERFSEDLKDANRKFRNFLGYSTTVIFFDLHSYFHRQDFSRLIKGQNFITVDTKQKLNIIKYGYQKRALRKNKNKEIGAIAVCSNNKSFDVYHIEQANSARKIKLEIFSSPNDRHYLFIDHHTNPLIKKLED